MMMYAIGVLVVAAVLAVGIFWIFSNVTFKKVPTRYTYTLDEEGNAVVKDTTDA